MHMQFKVTSKRLLPLQNHCSVPLKKRRVSGVQRRDLNHEGQFEDAPEINQSQLNEQFYLGRFVPQRVLPILAARDFSMHPQHAMVPFTPFIPRLQGSGPNATHLSRFSMDIVRNGEPCDRTTTFKRPVKEKNSVLERAGFNKRATMTPTPCDQIANTLDFDKHRRQPTYGTKLHARIRSEAPDALPRIQIDPSVIQSLFQGEITCLEEWKSIQHPHALLIPGGSRSCSALSELPQAPPVSQGMRTVKLGSMDVLLGRGGKTNVHLGNLAFRELCTSYRKTYRKLAKFEKQALIKRILNYCRLSGVRFLAEHFRGTFMEVGDERAFKKCSQLVREGTGTLGKSTDESDSQSD